MQARHCCLLRVRGSRHPEGAEDGCQPGGLSLQGLPSLLDLQQRLPGTGLVRTEREPGSRSWSWGPREERPVLGKGLHHAERVGAAITFCTHWAPGLHIRAVERPDPRLAY